MSLLHQRFVCQPETWFSKVSIQLLTILLIVASQLLPLIKVTDCSEGAQCSQVENALKTIKLCLEVCTNMFTPLSYPRSLNQNQVDEDPQLPPPIAEVLLSSALLELVLEVAPLTTIQTLPLHSQRYRHMRILHAFSHFHPQTHITTAR